MSVGTFDRNGCRLSYDRAGAGRRVIFQHGLGGDRAQVAEVFPGTAERLTVECRGHGGSEAGSSGFSIAGFADDIAAVADGIGFGRAVVGGISMGAAISLRLAVTEPARVAALVLARPAWLYDAAPENTRPILVAADCLARLGAAAGRAAFEASEAARRLAREAPDNLASLRGYFDRPDAATTAALLASIAADGPGVTEAAVARLAVPTLVLGTEADLIHPMGYARTLAATIPGARLVELTPKSVDRGRYAEEFKAALAEFLAGLPR